MTVQAASGEPVARLAVIRPKEALDSRPHRVARRIAVCRPSAQLLECVGEPFVELGAALSYRRFARRNVRLQVLHSLERLPGVVQGALLRIQLNLDRSLSLRNVGLRFANHFAQEALLARSRDFARLAEAQHLQRDAVEPVERIVDRAVPLRGQQHARAPLVRQVAQELGDDGGFARSWRTLNQKDILGGRRTVEGAPLADS